MHLERFIPGGLLGLSMLAGLRLAADDDVRGDWDNFNVPILQVRTSRPKTPPSAAPQAGPVDPEVFRKLKKPVLPSLSLRPPAVSMDDGFSTGPETIRYSVSPVLERRLDQLREEWTAVDAQRLEEARQHEGAWNRGFNTVFPEPVFVRVGHFDLGGGIITAVRRLNPFGLINQVFFSFSY